QVAVEALNAGVDIMLMPADFPAAYQGVLTALTNEQLSEERLDRSVYRILRAKYSMNAAA
ncbi:MAG: glycoside hydrolase family 3 N-terminal domain-containing protein, partial [Raoultibacter sp.]